MNSRSHRIQQNFEKNIFFNHVRAMLEFSILPVELSRPEVSAVDCTASAIVKLFDKINLSNQSIKDSDKIFNELSNVSEVTEVDLSGNQLTVLPGDLWKLKKLQSLDITNNPFANVSINYI